MPVTAQQKLTNAYNEFIRDYVEAHGQNQATRDEAHERADKLKVIAEKAVAFCFVCGLEDPMDVLEGSGACERNEAYLDACAVAVALEEVK